MKTFKLPIIITTVACLGFAAGKLQAQSNLVISVQLSVRTQGPTSQNGNVTTSSVQVGRLATKDLLQMLATATGKDFTNAKLVKASLDSNTYLVVNGTNILADVSSYFTQSFDMSVFSGSQNSTTGQQVYRGFGIAQLTFNDGGANNFKLAGSVSGTYVTSPKNAQGVQTGSDRIMLTTAGDGTVGGHFAVLSGTITISGSGLLNP